MNSHPVFIHHDSDVLNRISKESGGNARVTQSLVEALRWVANHEEDISGIFLCPDNTSFSTFEFLEITMNYRPAIPVFLFEKTLLTNNDSAKRIQNNTFIKGYFAGTESYETLVANLKPNTPNPVRIKRKKPRPEQELLNFTAVPISDFFSGERFPCDLYIQNTEGKMSLFAEKDALIAHKYVENLAEKIEFLYIQSELLARQQKTLKETLVGMIENKDFPDSWKTAEVMAKSKQLLSKIKNSGPTDPVLDFARTLLSDLQRLINNINTENGSLLRLINKALTSDRSLFCASLSILICQQLKFEKRTTLEILGIASVLQDISLYNTPFGNLTERKPESLSENEFKYYLRHPILSADIISHQTDVPQVTLQVLRQHHERKDRTGFPNHTGGTQLHPMAEILSLINACFDVSSKYSNQKDAYPEIERTIFPHYSEAMVDAFKKIHSRL